jgi:hypothetical protein
MGTAGKYSLYTRGAMQASVANVSTAEWLDRLCTTSNAKQPMCLRASASTKRTSPSSSSFSVIRGTERYVREDDASDGNGTTESSVRKQSTSLHHRQARAAKLQYRTGDLPCWVDTQNLCKTASDSRVRNAYVKPTQSIRRSIRRRRMPHGNRRSKCSSCIWFPCAARWTLNLSCSQSTTKPNRGIQTAKWGKLRLAIARWSPSYPRSEVRLRTLEMVSRFIQMRRNNKSS